MGAAWRITAKDLRLRLRDRSAILVVLVVPLVLAFIFNAVFGGAFGQGSITTLGYVDQDGGEVAAGLGAVLDSLESDGTLAVEEASGEQELREMVEEGEVAAGILVPEGFSAASLSGSESRLIVIGSLDSPTSRTIAEGVAQAFASGISDAQRAVQAVIASGGEPDPSRLEEIAQSAATAAPLATVGSVEAADRVVDPSTFFSASMAVFFLFFLVQFGVTGLIDEEREGTLTRLQAAPIHRWSIVMGKGLTSFILGMLALSVLAVASTLLMGADWGDPVGLAALFAMVTLAATSLLGIVAALARTPEGAGNLGAVIAVGLGMLGGTFFPVGGGNRFLEIAARATPHSWFLRGVGELQGGAGLVDLLPVLGALAAFAVGAGVIGAVLLVRRY